MADTSQPAVFVSGLTAGTFSTFQRDVSSGKVFSSRFSPETALIFDPASRQLFTVTSTLPEITTNQVFQFVLDSFNFPRNVLCLPGGVAFGAQGVLELQVAGAQPARLAARVSGLGPLPAGTELTVWLLHDLVVPPTLAASDLASLPRLAVGVNQPSQVFTVDGQPSTVGRAEVPVWNTIAVAVRAGTMTVQPDGTAVLTVPVTEEINFAVDPRVLLGPGFAPGPTAALPSGLVAAILTDVFMRTTTVFPDLSLATAFPQRLLAVTQAAVARFDRNGDGIISLEEAAAIPGAFLRPQDFNRAAITLEPVARATPLLVPTEQGVVLVGLQRLSASPG